MKIISIAKNIAKKSTICRIAMRNTRNSLLKARYKKNGKSVKVDPNLIVFSSYNGRGYVCSPKAIYEHMLLDSRFEGYKFVWIFDNPDDYHILEKNKNTTLIRSGSQESEKVLHEAKYWIFNFRALDHWFPKKDQIYVQCWHGTPLKRLGYDIEQSDNAMNSVKEIQSKYAIDSKRFDYLVSSCKFVSEKFSSAWNLKAFNKENSVVETGYPRNDFLKTFDEKDVERIKKKLGIDFGEKKIILYAPTWRDNQYDAIDGYVYDNPVDYDLLQTELSDDYIILFRAHYLVADNFDYERFNGFIYDVSKYDDINDLYILADILITDYSSVFFDYAILERPILFYMYDMEAYRDSIRGFYIDIDQLPGPIVKTEEELIEKLDKVDSLDYGDVKTFKQFNKMYNTMNDGHASERLCDVILNRK